MQHDRQNTTPKIMTIFKQSTKSDQNGTLINNLGYQTSHFDDTFFSFSCKGNLVLLFFLHKSFPFTHVNKSQLQITKNYVHNIML